MAEDERRSDDEIAGAGVAEIVHVGAADVGQRDLDEHRAGLGLRHRILADFEGLARSVEQRFAAV
jgi:hypothetical protein